MDRRAFVTGLGAVLAAPLSATAQQSGKVYRIAVLGMVSAPQYEQAFRDGLRDRGYVEGQNLVIESRWAEGKPERLTELASEVVRLRPDVIVTASNAAARAAKQATQTIPIVMTALGDPERHGLVASLAKPGGNVTGLTLDPGAEMIGKLLDFLKQTVPSLSRVAMIISADPWAHAHGNIWLSEGEAVARAMGVKVAPIAIHDAADIAAALSDIARWRVNGLLTDSSALVFSQRRKIVEVVSARRLPSAFPLRTYAEDGGLMAYGVDLIDLFRRAAGYVDRILNGAKAGDLPVEQPTKFELVVNLKTAKAIGLRIHRRCCCGRIRLLNEPPRVRHWPGSSARCAVRLHGAADGKGLADPHGESSGRSISAGAACDIKRSAAGQGLRRRPESPVDYSRRRWDAGDYAAPVPRTCC